MKQLRLTMPICVPNAKRLTSAQRNSISMLLLNVQLMKILRENRTVNRK